MDACVLGAAQTDGWKTTRLYLGVLARQHIVQHVTRRVHSTLLLKDIMDDVTEDKDVRIIFLIHSAYDMHVVKHNVSLCNALRVFPISSNIFLYAPGALIAAFPRIYKDNTYDIQYFYNAYGVPNIPRYTLDARLYPYITTYVKEYEHSRVRILYVFITPPYINGEYDEYVKRILNDMNVSYICFLDNKTMRYIGVAKVIGRTVTFAYACDICAPVDGSVKKIEYGN